MSWYSDGEKFDEYDSDYCKWHCPNGDEHDCEKCEYWHKTIMKGKEN